MKKLLILTLIPLVLSGCTVTKQASYDYTKDKFELDGNTVKISEQSPIYADNNITRSNSSEYDPNNDMSGYVAELTVENPDSSKDFVESGDDILYLTQTYVGLNKAEKSIQHPYSREEFINMILKISASNFESDTVKVILTVGEYNDEQTEESVDEEDTRIEFDSELVGIPAYEELKNKYNKRVNWSLYLIEETDQEQNFIELYGCSDYLLVTNTSEDITVDMKDFESSGAPSVQMPDGTVVDGQTYTYDTNLQTAIEGATSEFTEEQEEVMSEQPAEEQQSNQESDSSTEVEVTEEQ